MRKTKSQELIQLFHYWCGRLKINKPVELIKDNRIDCPMEIITDDNTKIIAKYNSRIIGQYPHCILLGYIFHEISHILNNLSYNTYKEKVYSEYRAEKSAHSMLQKYYPKEYLEILKYYKKKQTLKKLYKKQRLYYDAFIKIKEYKDSDEIF